MAKMKHFCGDVELTALSPMYNKEFAKAFPGVKGRKYDGYSMWVGQPIDFKPVYIQGYGWSKHYLPVERIIEYKSNPSKHECDARCINGDGNDRNRATWNVRSRSNGRIGLAATATGVRGMTTIAEFEKLVNGHDLIYAYSDDGNVGRISST